MELIFSTYWVKSVLLPDKEIKKKALRGCPSTDIHFYDSLHPYELTIHRACTINSISSYSNSVTWPQFPSPKIQSGNLNSIHISFIYFSIILYPKPLISVKIMIYTFSLNLQWHTWAWEMNCHYFLSPIEFRIVLKWTRYNNKCDVKIKPTNTLQSCASGYSG